MKFSYVHGPVLDIECDLLVIAVAENGADDGLFRAADKALGGTLTTEASTQRFTGAAEQLLCSYTHGGLPARQLLFAGLGRVGTVTPAKMRSLAASAAKVSRQHGAKRVCIVCPSLGARNQPRTVQFSVEGFLLGSYRYARFLHGDAAAPVPTREVLIAVDRAVNKSGKKSPSAERSLRQTIRRGEVVARAVCHARDLVNEPAATLNPEGMAKAAQRVAQKHASLTAKVLDAAECKKLGMNMFLAVGQGASVAPRLVHLAYKPARKAKRKLALIGKGITFDSGGYSLKPSPSMMDMKMDMAGSAAVIAAMDAIAELGSDYEVHAIAALAENLISGDAYKLGDVLTSMDGTTVEINNTDAEGRLTLGDAISYARSKVKPDLIIDFATLTGSCLIALGPDTAGVMSNDDPLAERWLQACRDADEDVWRLPLSPSLKQQLKSPIADMRNAGERYGGTLTAGLFLQHFVGDTPWVHNDIAGPAFCNHAKGPLSRGGTGFAVASIIEFVARSR